MKPNILVYFTSSPGILKAPIGLTMEPPAVLSDLLK